jgi:hypothetical protein
VFPDIPSSWYSACSPEFYLKFFVNEKSDDFCRNSSGNFFAMEFWGVFQIRKSVSPSIILKTAIFIYNPALIVNEVKIPCRME